jgi:myosin heavy subunit
VNPFQTIPNLYGAKQIAEYRLPYGDSPLPSHVYLIHSRAYANMCKENKNQSILISGESGAGTAMIFFYTR